MEQDRPAVMAITLWLANVAAAIEVIVQVVAKRTHPMRHLSEDVVWMAPLALVTLVTVAAGVPALLRRARVPGPWMAAGIFTGAVLAIADVLFLVPGLAPPAAGILALGAAAQWTRLVIGQRLTTLVRRTRLVLAIVSGVAAFGLWWSLRPDLTAFTPLPGSAARPNVVVMTLDTVRAANLGLYGYDRPTSPQLERIAARGVTFDAAFSTAPWTLPSHASLFTGRWPHELSADYDVPLDGRYPTLAGFLSAEGYRTAGFVANLSYGSAETGLGRGFQHYEDYPRSLGQAAVSSTLVRTVANNFRLRRLLENDEHLNRVHAPSISARALAWIDEHRDAPFMVFLNYFDAHEPYLPPPPFDARFEPRRSTGRHSPLHHWLWNPAVAHGNMGDRERREEVAAYDGALAALDDAVGRFFDALGERGLLDRTIVVITSDHGEEFGEHGVYDHGYSLYQRGVHVPLIVVAPGQAPPGRRVDAPVSLRDLAATVADLAGVGGRAPFPGTSLSAWWRAAPAAGPTLTSPAYFEVRPSSGQPDWFPSSKGEMTGAVTGNWHYIRNGDGGEELYDRTADPDEARNLAGGADTAGALAAARDVVDGLRPRSGDTR